MDACAVNQESLVWALDQLAVGTPAEVERAGRALALLHAGIHTSPTPEAAWSFSRLTGDGFPVEFTCSMLDASVRYTTEVVGPEVDVTARLGRACDVITRLGGPSVPEGTRTRLSRIQGEGALLYGAWVGGRHSPEGDRYKLYAEVPRAGSAIATRFAHDLLGAIPLLSERAVRLRMLSFEPATARTELYFRVEGLTTWEVGLLLRRAGLDARQADLLCLIAEVYGRTIEQALGRWRIGFSYSLPAAEGPVVFSLFTYAGSVLGGDADIRRTVLALGARKGWGMDAYRRLSAPLKERTTWKTRHSMIAFIIAPGAPAFVQLGLRPQEPAP